MELSRYPLEKLKLLHSNLTSMIRIENSMCVYKADENPLQFWVDEVTEAIKDREFEDNELPF